MTPPPSLLQEFTTATHEAWPRLLGARQAVRASGADPWVRQTAARIRACIPASGDDLESLLAQMDLTAAPRGQNASALDSRDPRWYKTATRQL